MDASQLLKRGTLWLIATGAVAFQVSSCDFSLLPPTVPANGTAVGSTVPNSAPSAVPRVVPSKVAVTRFSSCRQFFARGEAPAVPKTPLLRELCHDAFAILHSGKTRTPVFVAERLNRKAIRNADEERTDRFFADARLPKAERTELDDYKGSGYSQGHMAPAADMPTPTAMAQSFSLANMVPQNAKQNRDSWAKIERETQHYAARAKGDVFVITGPVLNGTSITIGENRVRVPSATLTSWSMTQRLAGLGPIGSRIRTRHTRGHQSPMPS